MLEIPRQEMSDLEQLAQDIKRWGRELGFQDIAISDLHIPSDINHLHAWLNKQYHGEMAYMDRHAELRANPHLLEPGTLRSISVRMDYLDNHATQAIEVLNHPEKAYISRYALGRDYHKLMRKRIAQLAQKIQSNISGFSGRAFVDSAPVLERALAQRAGLGWIGKNTMLLNEQAGSWFFLGELYTNLALPTDSPQVSTHCGTCTRCLTACPTQAIVAPYQVDARRCISYLTIELQGSIPEPLRKPMGNRVFGCDDCQLVCPFNKFAGDNQENDFKARHNLDNSALVDLFLWDEATFLKRTEGSAIRRIGYQRWLRNLAVGLGNAPRTEAIILALRQRIDDASPTVREHVRWALKQHDAI